MLLFIVLWYQLGSDLLDKPVLAPCGHINFAFCRLVCDQVQCLLELILADTDDAVWHVYKNAADVLWFASRFLLGDTFKLCPFVLQCILLDHHHWFALRVIFLLTPTIPNHRSICLTPRIPVFLVYNIISHLLLCHMRWASFTNRRYSTVIVVLFFIFIFHHLVILMVLVVLHVFVIIIILLLMLLLLERGVNFFIRMVVFVSFDCLLLLLDDTSSLLIHSGMFSSWFS